MRQAEKNVLVGWNMDWRLIFNDCQDYIVAVLVEYNRIAPSGLRNPNFRAPICGCEDGEML